MTDLTKKADPGRLMDALVQLIQEKNRLEKQKEGMEEALRVVSRGLVREDEPPWWRGGYKATVMRLVDVAEQALADSAAVEEG